jgi:hypothetical protein
MVQLRFVKAVGVCFLQKTGVSFYVRILVDLAFQRKMILEKLSSF